MEMSGGKELHAYLDYASRKFTSWVRHDGRKELSNVDEWQGEYVEQIPDGRQRIGYPAKKREESIEEVVDQGHARLDIGIHDGWRSEWDGEMDGLLCLC